MSRPFANAFHNPSPLDGERQCTRQALHKARNGHLVAGGRSVRSTEIVSRGLMRNVLAVSFSGGFEKPMPGDILTSEDPQIESTVDSHRFGKLDVLERVPIQIDESDFPGSLNTTLIQA